VTSNLAEAWARRRYDKSFVNKLIDSLGEENETEVWLDYSKDCKYISPEKHEKLILEYSEVHKMLISMINHPEKWECE
jgi:four helix bundle protein